MAPPLSIVMYVVVMTPRLFWLSIMTQCWVAGTPPVKSAALHEVRPATRTANNADWRRRGNADTWLSDGGRECSSERRLASSGDTRDASSATRCEARYANASRIEA